MSSSCDRSENSLLAGDFGGAATAALDTRRVPAGTVLGCDGARGIDGPVTAGRKTAGRGGGGGGVRGA
ncbi:hypothetical protein [Polyangium aurulentum]|uniref:hypothetical protein n=1 Tax=Polyangium aurulentum TaxID=2567896 RepID=UPI00146CA181|nr:hypothetical protein [Polyangium aurulentum]UQA61304.1 hypothetical protein E8A73_012820 [Polyangium aurulentum]